jgi:hypothetical protein
MNDHSDRETPNVILQREIETLFQEAFTAGFVLGARLRDMPEQIKRNIGAACGDAAKIEALIQAELQDIALSKLPRA